jgi:hypothetical protein
MFRVKLTFGQFALLAQVMNFTTTENFKVRKNLSNVVSFEMV